MQARITRRRNQPPPCFGPSPCDCWASWRHSLLAPTSTLKVTRQPGVGLARSPLAPLLRETPGGGGARENCERSLALLISSREFP
jgi:hypothetical protein